MNDTPKLIIVRDEQEFAQAMEVRRNVFVKEHQIPEYLEFDGNDFCATHILALVNGQPAGTMRIRYFKDFVKFERMCVLKPFRKTDISEQIMQKGKEFAAYKGYSKVYGICKKELLKRWEADGFLQIPETTPVLQNGMVLLPIYAPLQVPSNALTMQTATEILNAREGEWAKAEEEQAKAQNLEQFNEGITRLLHQVHLLKDEAKPENSHPPFKMARKNIFYNS